MNAGNLWFIAIVGGPILIAIGFIYALMRRRRMNRSEKVATAIGTKEVYKQEETGRPSR